MAAIEKVCECSNKDCAYHGGDMRKYKHNHLQINPECRDKYFGKLVLGDRMKSILKCKSNFNNAKYHYYCKEDFQILFNISERIGKNGNKIQRLRTQIQQEKKLNEHSSGA